LAAAVQTNHGIEDSMNMAIDKPQPEPRAATTSIAEQSVPVAPNRRPGRRSSSFVADQNASARPNYEVTHMPMPGKPDGFIEELTAHYGVGPVAKTSLPLRYMLAARAAARAASIY
jgi:hypothetical protein